MGDDDAGRARRRTGSRGLLAYVAEALGTRGRHAALDEFLAASEEEHGPLPADAIEEVRRQWPAARVG